MEPSKIFEGLKRYWGYDTFRPMQERIVGSLLGGRDACVVMPTGGGKSLCYQLPAALSEDKTVVVISPLIALMQDQLAQLTQMGIAAGMVNSTVGAARAEPRDARGGAGEISVAVFVAGAAGAGGHGRLAEARADFDFCDRRGALHFRVGARISAGVPAAEFAAGEFSWVRDCGVYGERDAAGAARHHRAIEAAGAG